ncbi:MAG TPA: precorrin-6y C5,15-methyltransferase (decarboxylating) subunit CbiE [Candidatus Deferrimicrobium sp.]|nr:precorrin-6y C5,15-methyltransferase (decarboxylating) subunit CbiE [Candidatus Deferrimicrobium sp.]
MIYVIGIGPGHPDYLLPAAENAAQKCQVLVGGQRALALFDKLSCQRFQVTGNLIQLKDFLRNNLSKDRNIGVLVSGDTGFYSLLPFLRKNFPETRLEVIPGISSLQLIFARAGLAWQEANLTSVHGRPLALVDTDPGQLLGLLTGKENSPNIIAQYLLKHGPNRRVWLGNNLSYPDEVVLETDLTSLALDESTYLNAVLIIMPTEEN